MIEDNKIHVYSVCYVNSNDVIFETFVYYQNLNFIDLSLKYYNYSYDIFCKIVILIEI